MTDLPKCPSCGENYTYKDGHIYICPICFHEWSDRQEEVEEEKKITKDAVGNVLEDGDNASVVKDLKLGSDTIKQGAKVTNIKILENPVNGHDIDAKVEGFGSLYLKSSVIKKVN